VVEEVRNLLREVYSKLEGIEEAFLFRKRQRTCVSNVRNKLRGAISALTQGGSSIASFLDKVLSMLVEEDRPRG